MCAIEDTLSQPAFVGEEVAPGRDLHREVDGVAPLLLEAHDQRWRSSDQALDILMPNGRLGLRQREAENSQVAAQERVTLDRREQARARRGVNTYAAPSRPDVDPRVEQIPRLCPAQHPGDRPELLEPVRRSAAFARDWSAANVERAEAGIRCCTSEELAELRRAHEFDVCRLAPPSEVLYPRSRP